VRLVRRREGRGGRVSVDDVIGECFVGAGRGGVGGGEGKEVGWRWVDVGGGIKFHLCTEVQPFTGDDEPMMDGLREHGGVQAGGEGKIDAGRREAGDGERRGGDERMGGEQSASEGGAGGGGVVVGLIGDGARVRFGRRHAALTIQRMWRGHAVRERQRGGWIGMRGVDSKVKEEEEEEERVAAIPSVGELLMRRRPAIAPGMTAKPKVRTAEAGVGSEAVAARIQEGGLGRWGKDEIVLPGMRGLDESITPIGGSPVRWGGGVASPHWGGVTPTAVRSGGAGGVLNEDEARWRKSKDLAAILMG
jgi:hypothetical protein